MVDQTEGAGLGIIIIVLMLRKIGLSRNNYKVFTNETETITQMLLPLNTEIDKQMDSLYEEFVDNLQTIPVFEETLTNFVNLASILLQMQMITCLLKQFQRMFRLPQFC